MHSSCSWCGAEDGVLWLIGLAVFIVVGVGVMLLVEHIKYKRGWKEWE